MLEPNQTSSPPCLTWDCVADLRKKRKRPCASKSSTHSASLHLCENVLLRAPTIVTCPHKCAPLNRSTPPPKDVFKLVFFCFLFTLETQRNKDPRPPPITALVLYFKHDKMFWLTSDLANTWYIYIFFLMFNWLVKLMSFLWNGKRHCYQGPVWTT